jgi:tetratricopeptide (TPR) repeat protein
MRREPVRIPLIVLLVLLCEGTAAGSGGEEGGARAEAAATPASYPGDPEEGTQLERRAVRAFQEHNYVEAARLFLEAWDAYQHPRYQFNVGQCCRHAGRWQQAVTAYRQRLELEPPPPNYIHAHIGYCLLRAGQREEANQAFSRYLELEPDGDMAPQVRRAMETGQWPEGGDRRPAAMVEAARRVHERAGQLVDQAQYREAAEAYVEGYRQCGEVHELLMNAAQCYLWAGQVEQAIETINRYLETPSPDPEGYAILADIREAEGDLGAVLAAYRRYLELAPDGNRALMAQGIVRHLSRLDPMPTRQQAAVAKQHFYRAHELFGARRYNDALREYLQAWEGWPTPIIRYDIGVCYYYTNRLEEALGCFTEYVQVMGDEGRQASTHLDIAQVLADMGRNEEAMRHIRAYRRRAEVADLPDEEEALERSRRIEDRCKEDD